MRNTISVDTTGRRLLGFLLLSLTLLAGGAFTALAQDITVNGSPHIGWFPVIPTAFATQDGSDVLPPGFPPPWYLDLYVWTLFDTGAERVYFDPGTALTLAVNNLDVLDIRINGLGAIDPATLAAPIYAGQAQAEVQDIPVSIPAYPPDVTLIGGPVTSVVKAVIDYTTIISRGSYYDNDGNPYTMEAPDITFYPAGTPVEYNPAITLHMQPFGTIGGPGEGSRYRMYAVSFNERGVSLSSPATGDLGAAPVRYMYDSGSNITAIKQVLANALELTGTPDFYVPTSDGGSLDGYYLDSITMTGDRGTYTVLDAPVVIVPDADVGSSAEALIGSNLFSQVKVLFDGPNATLGIGVATNVAPVADAGEDQVLEATGPTTPFTLDGTGSSDPDGDALTYSWTENSVEVGTGAIITLSGGLGIHVFTLTVTDSGGLASTDEVSITIRDTTPPTLIPPADITVPEADPMGTPVSLGAYTVSDNYDTNPSVTSSAPALFPLGTTTVIWTATDGSGNTSTAQQNVAVVPGTPLNQLGNLAKLIDYSVASGGIAPEMQTSLLAKINAAIAALVQGNPNASKVALNDLKALINQVEAQTEKKITPPIALEIITRANRVILALGG